MWKQKRTVSQTMGRQRNNPQSKRKEKSSERMLSEIKASQQSYIAFKTMVKRKPNELTENYQKLQGNYEELTANYISMKKDIETINKGQGEMRITMRHLHHGVLLDHKKEENFTLCDRVRPGEHFGK